MWKVINLIGRKFGRLIVLERAGKDKGGQATWKCLCECGTGKIIRSRDLRNGDAKSCGCWQKQNMATIKTTHGHRRCETSSLTYQTWRAMKARCLNSKCLDYMRYGARGITICDRWMEFENFLADMGERSVGLSLERINNYGNYEPNNCKWATPKEQANNRRNTKIKEEVI